MVLGILIPLGVLGAILLGAVLFLARGPAGADLSPRGLLRLYLYLASLVSVLVLAFGLSLVGTGLLGAVAPEFTYGSPPPFRLERPAPPPGASPPPGAVEKPAHPSPEELNDRRTRESLLEGITMALAGALFWAVHWYGRRRIETDADRASVLRRAYFLVGTAIFGIASIVLVPTAVYSVLRYFLIPVTSGEFRQGVGENLASAVVVVPVWLAYLRVVLDQQAAAAPLALAPTGAEVP